MEFPHMNPSGKSPRRSSELQGPRPTPLKINKDSHKIKKPPLPPQPSQPQRPARQPIIIYTVSPKIIHTTPEDFMNLVQRLTGSDSSSENSSSLVSSNDDPFSASNGGVVSPAARYASIEKTRSPKNRVQHPNGDMGVVEGVEIGTSMFHGILSPGPTSLSPIPASFFSPPSTSDPSVTSFFQDLSPVLHSSRNFMESGFMPSPSNLFVSPHTASIDLFNNFFN